MAAGACFHCGEPLPAHGARHVLLGAARRDFCCAGCEAAAELINACGLDDYYRVRTGAPTPAGAGGPDLSAWDIPGVVDAAVERDGESRAMTILVDGMRCAACAWLIQEVLKREGGFSSVEVNATTSRARLAWNGDATLLSARLAPLRALGYTPLLPNRGSAAAETAARRRALKKLVVAGLGMMQAMMFAEALYFGDDGSMDLATRDLFRWLGLLVSAPVIAYAGSDFFRGALLEWRWRRLGMDFLVSVTVLLAYVASFVETLRGGPAVYFDSAVMFVFLLLATRHLERAARVRANAAVDLLARAQPEIARRVGADGEVLEVPAATLAPGDVVRVRAGETVAADGVLLAEAASFSESLLTGESRPVDKRAGDPVLAGSHAVSGSADLRVTATGTATRIAEILRLVERAQSGRPQVARIADAIASRFIVGLLVAVIAVGLWWAAVDPSRVLPIVLAVLAVTCPCALSLAVPAAQAAAHARLASLGILVVKPDVLEQLPKVDVVVLDKTGTLTTGASGLARVDVLRGSEARALALAAALERESSHPIARAFDGRGDPALRATGVRVVPGFGIEGVVDGVACRIGRDPDGDGEESVVVLADGQGPIARFVLEEALRPEAAATVARLARGRRVEILSGDSAPRVAAVAATLGIEAWSARRSPEQKLARIRALQAEGLKVAMVGDGINDAAVLGGADVAIALGGGAALAMSAADAVVLGDRLERVADLVDLSIEARRNMRQNLAWALAYNIGGLPLAAAGFVPPWAAALGMSLSSLLVTLNALRIARWRLQGGSAPDAAVGFRPTPRDVRATTPTARRELPA
jgi:Cu2+-exporting ATPase